MRQRNIIFALLIFCLAIIPWFAFTPLFNLNRFARTFDAPNLFGASLVGGVTQDNIGSRQLQPTVKSGQNSISPITPLSPNIQVTDNNPPISEGATEIIPDSEDRQDQIDDLEEKIDVLEGQLAALNASSAVNDSQITLTDDKIAAPDEVTDTQDYSAAKATNIGGVGHPAYPTILISEIQVAGVSDAQQEFVELYNPNDEAVDLTNWYLQRKTKTGSDYGSYVSSTLFLGKEIAANSYFLIARTGSAFTGNIVTDNPLTNDNTLVLKNPDGDISDEVGWGAAQDFQIAPAPNPPAGQSIGREFVAGTEVDTGSNITDFSVDVPTPGAQNIGYIAPAAAITADNVAPIVVFNNLAPVQSNLSFPVNFTLTDAAQNAIMPSGIASYTFRWMQGGGDWQEDAPQSVNGAPLTFPVVRDFTGSDETNYYFQVKTEDAAGNESPWQPETPATTKISLFKKILINEIQTTGQTTKDEFIELYNPNPVDMDLTGFTLKKETADGTISNLVSAGSFSGIIKSSGFFLIAPPPNDDGSQNYTGQVAADLYYSGKTYSIAANNTVLLYDANNILLDKVGFGTAGDFETAAAQNPPAGQSIGRIKNTATGIFQDSDNNSADFQVQNPTPYNSDRIPPQISNIQVENISQNSADISWDTDEPSTSGLQYGQNVSYGMQSAPDSALVISHTLELSGLSQNTTYHYQVTSADASGNAGISSDQIFSTLAAADVTPPVISNGTPSDQLDPGTMQTDISVSTDEPAVCKYAEIAGQTYDQMIDSFSTTDGLLQTATVTGLTDGGSYNYYVKCVDLSGNVDADDYIISFSVGTLPPAPPDLPNPSPMPPQSQPNVVINEIAWMGTTSSANHEWMELFNPGNQDVNLAGWILQAADGTPNIALTGTIAADGFYLLERTGNFISGLTANQIYTGALDNAGENLSLTDGSDSLIDQVNCAAGWFAGSNTTKQTMQRINPLSSGNDATNWQTSAAPGGTPRL